MSDEPPLRIVLRADPLEELLALAWGSERKGEEAARLILRAIVADGRRYAATAEGRRLRRQLARSHLFKNGRILWNLAGVDEFLSGNGADTVRTLGVAATLDALGARSIEEVLMRAMETYAGQRFESERTDAGTRRSSAG